MAGVFTSPLTLTRHSCSIKISNPPAKPPLLLSRTKKCSLSCSSTSTSSFTLKSNKKAVISEGTDEDLHRLVCPGCGVFMQDEDPNLPGYFMKPSLKDKNGDNGDSISLDEMDEIVNIEDEFENGSDFDEDLDGFSDYEEFEDKVKKSKKKDIWKSTKESRLREEQWLDEFLQSDDESTIELDSKFENEDVSDWDSDLKKISKSKKGTKSKSSSLDQFLQEEEEDSFSDLNFESENDEFSDLDLDEDEEEEDSDWDKDWDELDENKKRKLEMDGFAPAGVGYGNITKEYLQSIKKEKISKSEKKKKIREQLRKTKKEESLTTVCARCYSLKNHGLIKNPNAENLIPDFDFNKFISTRIINQTGTNSVVILVVDCTDFDASFPKTALKSLFKTLESAKKSKLTKLPKIILVATKVDLLPSQVSPARLDRWVRTRSKSNGAHNLDSVILTSSRKDLNIRNLITAIKNLSGPRGNVWVIGAQNAGKSTLINAIAKKERGQNAKRQERGQNAKSREERGQSEEGQERGGVVKLTEAAVPGTTLGILRVTGVLPEKVKMFDTPGLLHPGLVINRLNREEQKMVEIRKELKPRSYRIKVGQAVHVGGLMRLDLTEANVQTIYVTIWASPNISLHMGKTENSEEMRKHFGARLQPPIGQDRAAELGTWAKREFKIRGKSWDENSVDIAVAGLGWFSLGLKGEASVELWTFEGVDVAQREPLVLDRAYFLERPGFCLTKKISEELGRENKRKAEEKRRLEVEFDEEEEDLLLEKL